MAVRSNDFKKVYFVAAKIYGPGIEDGEGPGVWFITGDPTSPGMIMSVNSYAKLFSDYPDANTTKTGALSNLQATMSNDGAMEARNCAE